MTYAQVEEYINNIQKFAKKNDLAHTREVLRLLGEPQEGIKIIHVAGTNGKGSTCNYLRALLRGKGYRVGMFISPHLVTMRERMILDETVISEQDFVSCFEMVLSVVRDHEINHPTFFEFLFLMAMVFYGKEKPDYLILETGLGGRLDATNVFEKPVMTIITEIGLDHQQYLGDTKEKIAFEKAGIIKPNVPLVFAKREENTAMVMEKIARNKGARVYVVDKNTYFNRNIRNKGIDFSYNSLYYNYIDISLPTYAYYQAENASLAMTAFELLMGSDNVTPEFLQNVMKDVTWSGRMEQIAENIYVDGAHNEDGMTAFLETVAKIPVTGRRILLFSVVDDKAYEHMIKSLTQSELFSVYIVANIRDSRGLPDTRMSEMFSDYMDNQNQKKIIAFENVQSALHEAQKICTSKDVVFCVGSLYLIGEIKALLVDSV